MRVERDHRRLGVQRLGHRAHVVDRHGAHGAQRLRDDQVGLQPAQRVLVELVDRPALLGQLPHRAVDLRRGQAAADDIARHPRALARLLRVVALVGDGGDVVADPEGEQDLGGRGYE